MIRPLERRDLLEVARLEARGAARPWDLPALTSWFGGAHARGWVALDGPIVGHLLGVTVLDEAEIYTFVVAPHRRRQGWGRRLLRRALDGWRADGVRAVHLEVRADNRAARALYAAAGFEQVGLRERYYGHHDALLLRWCP